MVLPFRKNPAITNAFRTPTHQQRQSFRKDADYIYEDAEDVDYKLYGMQFYLKLISSI